MNDNNSISYDQAISIGLWGDKIIPLTEKLEEFLKLTFNLDTLTQVKTKRKEAESSFFPVVLPESNLSEAVYNELKSINDLNVSIDAIDRLKYSLGKSYYDLIKLRNGKITTVVDAVVGPASIESVRKLLSIANTHRIYLIPTGGKTSVTETLSPKEDSASIAIDMLKLNNFLNFYEKDLLIEVETGILLPELEEWLNQRGYKLGHSPQSFMFTSVGGAIASRGSGQFSSYFGSMRKLNQPLNLRIETELEFD